MKPVNPKKDDASPKSRDWTGFIIVMLVLLGLPLSLLGVQSLEYWGNSKVVATQPIGTLLRMSAPGGFGAHVVIETEQGFYPLIGSASIAKGTPLVLELRGSGKRYVCDTGRSLCLETTAEHFGSEQGAKP